MDPKQRYLLWKFPKPPSPPPAPSMSRPKKVARTTTGADSSTPAPLAARPDSTEHADAPPPEDHSKSSGLPGLAPPVCNNCGDRRWPVHRNKKGNFNCKSCSAPKGGTPVCIRCEKESWDGMCAGARLCKAGRHFICRQCWIDNPNYGPSSHEWAAWFQAREDKCPDAFSS